MRGKKKKRKKKRRGLRQPPLPPNSNAAERLCAATPDPSFFPKSQKRQRQHHHRKPVQYTHYTAPPASPFPPLHGWGLVTTRDGQTHSGRVRPSSLCSTASSAIAAAAQLTAAMAGKGLKTLGEAMRSLSLAAQPCRTLPVSVCFPFRCASPNGQLTGGTCAPDPAVSHDVQAVHGNGSRHTARQHHKIRH